MYFENQYKITKIKLQKSTQTKFEQIQLSNFKNVQKYFNKIENAKQNILNFENFIIDKTIIFKIIRNLTREYNEFINYYYFFKNINSNILNFVQIIARLFTFDIDLQQRKNVVKIMFAIANDFVKKISIMKCNICDKNKHFKKRC